MIYALCHRIMVKALTSTTSMFIVPLLFQMDDPEPCKQIDDWDIPQLLLFAMLFTVFGT